MNPKKIQLIIRTDDAGLCPSTNAAIHEVCAAGAARNVSVMVPAPAFAEAAKMLTGLTGISIGLHITLNAEWTNLKWGPVLPLERVPSLVDANGHFFPTPMVLHERGFSDAEALAEIEAQLALARQHGLSITYLDEHMGISWIGGLRAGITALAQRERLVDTHSIPGLPRAEVPAEPLVANWCARLAITQPGPHVLVSHPSYAGPDLHALCLPNQASGQVAPARNAERLALLDPQWRAACRADNVESIRYVDAARS